jgi:hypothetical protein
VGSIIEGEHSPSELVEAAEFHRLEKPSLKILFWLKGLNRNGTIFAALAIALSTLDMLFSLLAALVRVLVGLPEPELQKGSQTIAEERKACRMIV